VLVAVLVDLHVCGRHCVGHTEEADGGEGVVVAGLLE
jgi:hypothetical protein